ncbi:MAG: hypothetical protein C0404_13205, partial [Verrucomicrobia bacterium]|nr:hypothetical protein [Verrucomicrobiota bacterium]
MPEPANYIEKVYAGVLGKVIGVYIGQPFEGWLNERIEKELGEVSWYVNEKFSKPLVVSDDDISGTFTFIRALDDHMASRNITSEQIGKTWLNYLVEYENILWWGGMGVSTEHTAWLRLKAGIPAPLSGAIETNGRVVAEQIGAQIFIDGWAMVAPGDPELAVELAGRAGRVSHDGAAVHGAQAVAAMQSLAFAETDMTRLLDCALKYIPKDSVIYAVHQDVREWASTHGDDWRKTFARIKDKYGYDKFGGGCHIVPNHAVMVMAWAHAPDDFTRAMMICGTAGWDTDCNLANVGCLMGIKGGLAAITAGGRDWRGPFADRMIIPTAKGTTDALREADMIIRMGRRMMGWREVPAPKKGARFHFSLPGSLHGFIPEDGKLASLENVQAETGSRCLKISFRNTSADKPATVSTPTFLQPDYIPKLRQGYAAVINPTLYSGQKLTASVSADKSNKAPVSVALSISYYTEMGAETKTRHLACDAIVLEPGASGRIEWTVPDTDGGFPIYAAGLSIHGTGAGAVYMDAMDWSGSPKIAFRPALYRPGYGYPYGWTISGKPATLLRAHDTMTELMASTGI